MGECEIVILNGEGAGAEIVTLNGEGAGAGREDGKVRRET
jgi:hypothetical protein